MTISKTLVLITSLALVLSGCDEKPEEKTASGRIQFAIPGTVEQVVVKNDDGSAKLSVFVDEKTQKKVAEVEYHPNGQPKIHKHFVNDTLNGESWCYYPDGKPWSLNTFRDGVYEGPYKTWNENGQPDIDAYYHNGKPDGDFLKYYPNGQLDTRGIYENGERIGLWSWYNLEGKLMREKDYSAKTPAVIYH